MLSKYFGLLIQLLVVTNASVVLTNEKRATLPCVSSDPSCGLADPMPSSDSDQTTLLQLRVAKIKRKELIEDPDEALKEGEVITEKMSALKAISAEGLVRGPAASPVIALHTALAAQKTIVACPGWCAMDATYCESPCSACTHCGAKKPEDASTEEPTTAPPSISNSGGGPALVRPTRVVCNPTSKVNTTLAHSSSVNTLIFSDPGDGMVKAADMDGSNVRDVVNGVTPCPEVLKAFPSLVRSTAMWASRPTGIAVDKAANKLFFTDWLGGYEFPDGEIGALEGLVPSASSNSSAVSKTTKTGAIYSAPLSGSTKNMVVVGLAKPWGIAADTVNQKIYWTDQTAKKVMRANYNGTGAEDIVTGLTEPRGIAVDEVSSKIYFADAAQSSKIMRANLDGSSVEDLVLRTGYAQPEGVALNLKTGKVYWTERGLRRVHRSNLDGSVVEELMNFDTSHTPTGIVVDADNHRIYVADEEAGIITSADLDGCNSAKLLTVSATWDSKPWGVALM